MIYTVQVVALVASEAEAVALATCFANLVPPQTTVTKSVTVTDVEALRGLLGPLVGAAVLHQPTTGN